MNNPHNVRGLLITLFSVLLISACASISPGSAPAPAWPKIDSAHAPQPNRYILGQPSPAELVALERAGARHVVNARDSGEFDAWNEGELVAELAPFVDEAIRPDALASVIEASGVRNRAVVVSACYSGGFLPALGSPDALVITAAREDRTSFGCGASSHVTWFGQAWLVDGLNRHDDFIGAFEDARREVARREEADDYTASHPQLHVGDRIGPVLEAWRESLEPGPAVAYPWQAPTQPASEAASDP